MTSVALTSSHLLATTEQAHEVLTTELIETIERITRLLEKMFTEIAKPIG